MERGGMERGGEVVDMRKRRSADAGPTDAVVLIPGFIGFSRIGRFYYFSERIVAALRARLEARLGRAIVVVPACTRSIDPLEARQAFLLEQLAELCGKLPGLCRLHLVGHSTGGVDAQLLTCDRPLGDRSWSPYDRVRRRIASVVAIAAPQRGTFLARSMAARFVANPFRHYRGFAAFADVVVEIFPVVLRHPAALDLLSGLARQIPELLALRKRIGQHGRLIEQLEPEAMAELRARVCPEQRVRLTSFVTVAGLSDDAPTPPDPFFRDLYALIAAHAVPDLPGLPPALERLRAHRHLIAGETTLEPGAIGAHTNDGVVSSGLQLLDPDDPDELGGIVVADHGDVIGHYDRKPALLDKEPLNVGIFHSGSGFNDDAFFELYGHVADVIARAIPELQDAGEPRRGLEAI
jgi:pimeloyl-ACP methyl ester carboxylesterase